MQRGGKGGEQSDGLPSGEGLATRRRAPALSALITNPTPPNPNANQPKPKQNAKTPPPNQKKGGFVASWTGVIRFHGPRPTPGPGRVWVANHTSMIDYIILSSYSAFAVIMQLHGGWVGFLQTKVLDSLGCLWFNRTEVKDRHLVAQRMRQHVHARDATPLLIFPEGT